MSVPYDSPTAGESAGTDKIFIPDTVTSTWPWPRHLNQHFPEVNLNVEIAAWVAGLKVLDGARVLDTFERVHLDLMAYLGHPIASKARLVTVIDEYSDVSKSSEVREQKKYALHNPHKPCPKGEWVVGEMARQFWERTICDATTQSQKQFITAFNLYLEATMQQAIDRNEHRIRDVQSYMDVRLNTITTKTFSRFAIGPGYSR
ncbi:hypothetical protein F4604DRAFT_1915571 [Suillus subluteus]|nr:hypothetical protein F4604DRAFT_1915571 [Suillus subluteus]